MGTMFVKCYDFIYYTYINGYENDYANEYFDSLSIVDPNQMSSFKL